MVNRDSKACVAMAMIQEFKISQLRSLNTANKLNLEKLLSGTPSTKHQDANTAMYFYYDNYLESDLKITLTPQTGTANFTVTPILDTTGSYFKMYNNLPSRTNYTWTTSTDKNLLYIQKNDTNYCYKCHYIIGVFTDKYPCLYTISIKNELFPTVLTNGIPVKGYINEGKDAYYTLKHTCTALIHF